VSGIIAAIPQQVVARPSVWVAACPRAAWQLPGEDLGELGAAQHSNATPHPPPGLAHCLLVCILTASLSESVVP